jgi:hypothetical protein
MSHLLVALVKARASMPGVLLQALLACAIVLRHRFEPRLTAPVRRALDALTVLALLAWAGLAAADAWSNVRYPRPWDFPSFYAVADAAAHGRNFYDPGVLTSVQSALGRTQGVPGQWLSEVGYWYLPPSVFVILPLGFFGFRAALVLHYLVQGLLLVGCAALMRRQFAAGPGWLGFASSLLLLLIFPPAQSTIYFAQIVFGCLFFLLLAERLLERSPVAAGAALAAGFFFKHLLLIPALVLLVGRDRRGRVAGLSAVGGIVLALLASMVVFGRGILVAWSANGPGARSEQLAIDPVVQSLLALIYRGLHATPHGSLAHIILYPPFLVAAGALGLVTLALLWRAPARTDAGRFWLVAALAILAYPNTLISTLALAAPVALFAASRALRAGWPALAALAVVAVAWALPGLAPVHAGWIAVMAWAVLAVLAATSPAEPATAK